MMQNNERLRNNGDILNKFKDLIRAKWPVKSAMRESRKKMRLIEMSFCGDVPCLG
jgi:hypothetical protein